MAPPTSRPPFASPVEAGRAIKQVYTVPQILCIEQGLLVLFKLIFRLIDYESEEVTQFRITYNVVFKTDVPCDGWDLGVTTVLVEFFADTPSEIRRAFMTRFLSQANIRGEMKELLAMARLDPPLDVFTIKVESCRTLLSVVEIVSFPVGPIYNVKYDDKILPDKSELVERTHSITKGFKRVVNWYLIQV